MDTNLLQLGVPRCFHDDDLSDDYSEGNWVILHIRRINYVIMSV